MSKPGADPSSGISLEDVLRLTKRHPACRRREAQPGSCMERENLAGDAKGKDAMGRRRANCLHRRVCETMEPPNANAERIEPISYRPETGQHTDCGNRNELVELAGCRHRAWRRAPAVEEAHGRRERIAEASQSLA